MDYPNWFQGAVPNFENALGGYKDKECSFLQLGVYTGDASLWLCKNILTNDKSTLTDVDIWSNDFIEVGYNNFDWENVESIYDKKVNLYKNKIIKKKQDTYSFFNENKNKYDFVYIDAEHTAEATLLNAINSYYLCKNEGVIAFDDYEWDKDPNPYLKPKKGIDAFLKYFEGNLEILIKNYQLWVRVHK
jgi:predicted O-methyltransferase YrrM